MKDDADDADEDDVSSLTSASSVPSNLSTILQRKIHEASSRGVEKARTQRGSLLAAGGDVALLEQSSSHRSLDCDDGGHKRNSEKARKTNSKKDKKDKKEITRDQIKKLVDKSLKRVDSKRLETVPERGAGGDGKVAPADGAAAADTVADSEENRGIFLERTAENEESGIVRERVVVAGREERGDRKSGEANREKEPPAAAGAMLLGRTMGEDSQDSKAASLNAARERVAKARAAKAMREAGTNSVNESLGGELEVETQTRERKRDKVKKFLGVNKEAKEEKAARLDAARMRVATARAARAEAARGAGSNGANGTADQSFDTAAGQSTGEGIKKLASRNVASGEAPVGRAVNEVLFDVTMNPGRQNEPWWSFIFRCCREKTREDTTHWTSR